MQKHTKLILKHIYGEVTNEYHPCEICATTAVDTHHIIRRGLVGKKADRVENLMMVCRKCHNEYGDKPDWLLFLFGVHFTFLDLHERPTEISSKYKDLILAGEDVLVELKLDLFGQP